MSTLWGTSYPSLLRLDDKESSHQLGGLDGPNIRSRRLYFVFSFFQKEQLFAQSLGSFELLYSQYFRRSETYHCLIFPHYFYCSKIEQYA